MKVYLLVLVIPYEGETPLGVYAVKDDAEAAAKVWVAAGARRVAGDLSIYEYVVGAEPADEPAAAWRVKS